MFCPKCGALMTATRDGTTVECVRGGMELSIALRAALEEVFVDRRRSAKRIPLRWGDGWSCPGCGVPMNSGAEHVRCPRCGEHLDEFLYQLIELHPHRHLVLVVEDVFEAPGRTVVLAPSIALSDAVPGAAWVELRRPDGSRLSTPARVHLPLGRAEPAAVVRLENATKNDVPIGTEVWLLR